MRVLVVDDEPLAREGLVLMLADHPDVEVVGEAGNGRDGLGELSVVLGSGTVLRVSRSCRARLVRAMDPRGAAPDS